MATTLKRRARARQDIILDESVSRFLLTGEAERGTPGWSLRVSRFFDQGEKIRLAWAQHREFLLAKWRKEKNRGLPWAETRFKINGGSDQ
ncbi:MAG: hypothetical protein M0009_02415 [Deltaproteobacteria bacterium]|nr:hypothetical protein [Deltaproteobacteria bacterium]